MRLWLTFYLFFLVSTTAIAVPGPGDVIGAKLSDSAQVRIIIRDRVQLKHDVITLGDLAEVSAITEKEKKKFEGIVITTVSGKKSKITIPGKYIRSRIREVAATPRSMNIKIPEQVEVEIKKNDVSGIIGKRILSLIADRSAIPEGIAAELDNFSDGLKKADLTMAKSGEIVPVHRKTFWRGRTFFSVNDANGKKVLFSVRIRWFAYRWIANRTIQRGSKMSSKDFSLQRTEVRRNRDDSIKTIQVSELKTMLRNSTARNSLVKDNVLRKSHINFTPDQLAGSPVRVALRNPSGVQLMISGKLLKSSRIGDLARAKISKTGKVVNGVLREGQVLELQD